MKHRSLERKLQSVSEFPLTLLITVMNYGRRPVTFNIRTAGQYSLSCFYNAFPLHKFRTPSQNVILVHNYIISDSFFPLAADLILELSLFGSTEQSAVLMLISIILKFQDPNSLLC